MKTKKILTSIAIIFTFSSINAQINVLSDGSSTELSSNWTGGIKTGVVTFGCCQLPCIYPVSCWYGTLGTQTNYFAGAYIQHIFSSIYDKWPSDQRLKENISNIDSAIYKLKLLNPVRYDIKASVYDSVPKQLKSYIMQNSKNNIGFVAQDIQKIFPQMVHKEPSSGYYGISTMDLIPVLVQAIKDQQVMIENLQTEINKLKTYKGNSK